MPCIQTSDINSRKSSYTEKWPVSVWHAAGNFRCQQQKKKNKFKSQRRELIINLNVYTTVVSHPFSPRQISSVIPLISPSVSTLPTSHHRRDVWAARIGVQLGATFMPYGTSLGSRALGSAWTAELFPKVQTWGEGRGQREWEGKQRSATGQLAPLGA